MDETTNTSQRNIDYVVSLVNEKPGKLDLFELTKQTRLRHSHEDPLGLKDTIDAIGAAIENRLIEYRAGQGFLYEYKKMYYPVQKE